MVFHRLLLFFIFTTFSSQAFSLDFIQLMKSISEVGAEITIFNGMQLTEDIIVTIDHGVNPEKYRAMTSPFIFKPGNTNTLATLGITESTSNEESQIDESPKVVLSSNKIHPVLIINVAFKNEDRPKIYCINKVGDQLIANKVITVIDDISTTTIDVDPIKILLLTKKPNLDPLKRRELFFNNLRELAHYPLIKIPDFNLRFMFYQADIGLSPITQFKWDQSQDSVLSLVKTDFLPGLFFAFSAKAEGGMSGGGVFWEEQLIGLISTTITGFDMTTDIPQDKLRDFFSTTAAPPKIECLDNNLTSIKAKEVLGIRPVRYHQIIESLEHYLLKDGKE